MDYMVGSIAALISGNVTPNRPKQLKKAHTPIKQPPSPNVTPKSEFVEDRSIFLSPTMQKKKAIVKKSPKRIFQNPNVDVTNGADGDSSLLSPKADKVKKHLKDELGADQGLLSPKLVRNENKDKSPTKKSKKSNENIDNINENMSKHKKKKLIKTEHEKLVLDSSITGNGKETTLNSVNAKKVSKKKSKKLKSISDSGEISENSPNLTEHKVKLPKKKNKQQSNGNTVEEINSNTIIATKNETKKLKKSRKSKNKVEIKSKTEEKFNVNPNAVTNKDTDSEHESDDEIESENENINKQAFDTEIADHSSGEGSDEEKTKKKKGKVKRVDTKKIGEHIDEDAKRTIFIGNVLFSLKCKKKLKKIFSQYGQIETVRIRTVPVKDPRFTPKMAVIKQELHPDRTTVNAYIKYVDVSSVDKALSANNVVMDDYHLRVTRSESSGVPHDPKCSVFVGNIPFALEDEALRAKFEMCGVIESVRIIRDNTTKAGKGFGYVNFASKDGVELALALTEEDLTIKNRILRVKRTTQPTQNQLQRRNDLMKLGKKDNNTVRNFGKGKFGAGQHDSQNDGAYRRVMNKRKNSETGGGPPNKKQNLDQPHREKKPRKEFVGTTAEKRKKNKLKKGLKKKKALSEILTK